MVRVLETQTVDPSSIPLPLHVVLELNKHSLAFPCSEAVWLGLWNSEHDEAWKWAMEQWDRPVHYMDGKTCISS